MVGATPGVVTQTNRKMPRSRPMAATGRHGKVATYAGSKIILRFSSCNYSWCMLGYVGQQKQVGKSTYPTFMPIPKHHLGWRTYLMGPWTYGKHTVGKGDKAEGHRQRQDALTALSTRYTKMHR